jgi:nicotinamidase-related amidase
MRLSAASRLCLIDLQAGLLAAIPTAPALLARCQALIQAANLLGIPVAATVQNPDRLGGLADELVGLVPPPVAKRHFDASRQPDFLAWASAGGTVVVTGTEAHVCVLQTALGLRGQGLAVACVSDAIASRHPEQHRAALDRLRADGVELLTTEMLLFEWLDHYDRPEFRPILQLIKTLPPPD